MILSGALMFEHLGWNEVSERILSAVSATIGAGEVTYDLHRQMEGATLMSCSGFGDALISRL